MDNDEEYNSDVDKGFIDHPLPPPRSPLVPPPTPTLCLGAGSSQSPQRLDEGDPYPPNTTFEEAAKHHGYDGAEGASGPTVIPPPLTPASNFKTRTARLRRNLTPISPRLISLFSTNIKKSHKSGPPTPTADAGAPTMENRLAVIPRTEQKTKAIEDARAHQALVWEDCKKSGKEPPPYYLEELIGKGAFGRVYKGKDMTTAKIVAVKIIDIDESDTLNPKQSDAYSEFLKEVNALKLLGENNAKNINLVLEALPVGKAMWMITEHCGGGSVHTLMKPFAPTGLSEQWLRIVLREAAEGLFWVHQAGIIHRDLKCANILVTEKGDVQICDFGVAGIIENKTDKRSTIIGTPHWMAPELLSDQRNATTNYGKEIDIWAFGAMAFEMATGMPPMADTQVFELREKIMKNSPRLAEGQYSADLRDLVAACMQNDPEDRPAIEAVQDHPYIRKSPDNEPSSKLMALILHYREWENEGGTRRSLFWGAGAQAPSSIQTTEHDEWIFSTTEDFDSRLNVNAYNFTEDDAGQTARPPKPSGRAGRRAPAAAMQRGLPVDPLVQLFDPNTKTNYQENIDARYGRDLPLRDNNTEPSIRDTMIDLGGHDFDDGSSFSNVGNMDTIRADRQGRDAVFESSATFQDLNQAPLSDPADGPNNRRTQDWKFPSAPAMPASAAPELSHFPSSSYELPRPVATSGSGGRPQLKHHPTEPLPSFSFGGSSSALDSSPGMDRVPARESRIDLDLEPTPNQRISMAESLIDLDAAGRASMRQSFLIDLDMSMPDPIPAYRGQPDLQPIQEFQRPSTANSDNTANPFELEKHASMYLPGQNIREPSIYVSDPPPLPSLQNGNALQELGDMSDFSGASDAEGITNGRYGSYGCTYSSRTNGRYEDVQRGRSGTQRYDSQDDSDHMPLSRPLNRHPVCTSSLLAVPAVSAFPTSTILAGNADPGDVAAEMSGQISALMAQLLGFRNVFESQEVMKHLGRDPPGPRP